MDGCVCVAGPWNEFWLSGCPWFLGVSVQVADELDQGTRDAGLCCLLGLQWAYLVADQENISTSSINGGREMQHGIFSGAEFVSVEARKASGEKMLAKLFWSPGWAVATSTLGQEVHWKICIIW